MCFGPAQVHPEQHLRPVLRLGTARAGLDVEERVGRVQLAAEHAPELELAQTVLETGGIVCNLRERRLVPLLECEIEELARVGEAGRERLQGPDDLLERRALPPEGLGTLGVVPDTGLLELALDFGEPLGPGIVVKGTSSAR
jgi:hypothetical protein